VRKSTSRSWPHSHGYGHRSICIYALAFIDPNEVGSSGSAIPAPSRISTWRALRAKQSPRFELAHSNFKVKHERVASCKNKRQQIVAPTQLFSAFGQVQEAKSANKSIANGMCTALLFPPAAAIKTSLGLHF